MHNVHCRSERRIESVVKGNTTSPSDQGAVARVAQLENKLEQANEECSLLKKQVCIHQGKISLIITAFIK